VTSDGTTGEFPGNFDGDNVIDAGDYVAWRKIDGESAGYDAWQANFGATGGGGSAAAGAIPEPSTALLLAVACSLLTQGALRRASKLVGM
jgi:hypothetical protein